jgi:SAM-dependent methyltransferase
LAVTEIDYGPIARAYARHRQVHPHVLARLCRAVDRSSRVLEVGCGTGNYVIAIASQVGCACWGIDPSVQMIECARGRLSQVRFRLGRAEALDLPSGAYDLVYSVDVIHHVRDRAAYYRAAARGLVSGGRLCTVTDSEWVICHRQPLAVYFPETVEIELKRYPRITELCALMEKAGFEQIEEETVAWSYTLADAGAYRDKAFSILHLISEPAYRSGLERMERDLAAGPIQGVSRYTLLWGRKGAP